LGAPDAHGKIRSMLEQYQAVDLATGEAVDLATGVKDLRSK
jgi:hypothetical protein